MCSKNFSSYREKPFFPVCSGFVTCPLLLNRAETGYDGAINEANVRFPRNFSVKMQSTQ